MPPMCRVLGYTLAFLPGATLYHVICRPPQDTGLLPATGEACSSVSVHSDNAAYGQYEPRLSRVYRQPDRFRSGLSDAVFHVPRDSQIISFSQLHQLAAGKLQGCVSAQ